MQKKIGLYFGSFNPIHIGHLIIAQQALIHTNIDTLWFVVSPQNPFKNTQELLSASDRLALVQCAIRQHPQLHASDIEFSLPTPSYTYITLEHLRTRYAHFIFSLIVGSDTFIHLPEWKNGHIILQKYPLYIYERPGFPIPNKSAKNIHIMSDIPLLSISASFIRQQIRQGKPITYLVHNCVARQIIEKKHYQNST